MPFRVSVRPRRSGSGSERRDDLVAYDLEQLFRFGTGVRERDPVEALLGQFLDPGGDRRGIVGDQELPLLPRGSPALRVPRSLGGRRSPGRRRSVWLPTTAGSPRRLRRSRDRTRRSRGRSFRPLLNGRRRRSGVRNWWYEKVRRRFCPTAIAEFWCMCWIWY